MVTYEQLQRRPDTFKNLTGITLEQFEQLYAQIAPVWADVQQNRPGRRARQRSVGGGRKYALSLKEQLLMSLLRRHLLLNTEAAGFFFGVDKSTVSRNTRRILAALRKLEQNVADLATPPSRGLGKTAAQALQDNPALQEYIAEIEAAAPKSPLLQEPEQPEYGDDSLRFLAQTPPFQGLSTAELTTVRQAAQIREIERHAFLHHQGDPANAFYILLAGQARLTEVTPDGHQLLVRFVSPGGAIGIIAALENTVYPLAAQAVDNCRALAWNSATLEQLMERFPRIAINGLRLVAHRWGELEERYRELATERVERRIAQTLLRLVQQVGRRVERGILIDLPLTRQDLAEMTGTTLYTVSRILSRWEQEDLIETRREQVLIRYPHGLARIAEDLPPESPR